MTVVSFLGLALKSYADGEVRVRSIRYFVSTLHLSIPGVTDSV